MLINTEIKLRSKKSLHVQLPEFEGCDYAYPHYCLWVQQQDAQDVHSVQLQLA